MKCIVYTLMLAMLLLSNNMFAEPTPPPTIITGTIMSGEEMVSFAAVTIEGTTIGATSDANGIFKLNNIPAGNWVLKVQSIGYKPTSLPISVVKGETKELQIEIAEDVLGLEEVVITGDRNEKNRKDASVIVNTLTPKLFKIANAVTLSDGLNFSPGLRMENNCQNCGFNQVRMNGMEGPYSQVLINGRAIFSGLSGVYGLELIPANMLERIEVVRGGGSALYGSNAIAGTINLILKDPIRNTFEFGYSNEITGVGAVDNGDLALGHSINGNASVVTDDNNSGLALYGFYRDRDHFDANNDGYSELGVMNNTTFGARFFHRFGHRSKITGDFFNIKESRRGGDQFDKLLHESNVSEAVDHNILTGALTFERYFRTTDLWSVYAAGQSVNRDSYYGANQSLKDYGNTKGLTYTVGSQYIANFYRSNLTAGIEGRFETLLDKKLGYPDLEHPIMNITNTETGADTSYTYHHIDNTIVSDQVSNTLGIFAQYDYDFEHMCISIGGRFDRYSISDNLGYTETKSGGVFSPRVTIKYDVLENIQARVSYSKGYRAPQIFDEDLHIITSGSRKVLHQNDPNLEQETSHSYMASIDYTQNIENLFFEILIEGFYTQLNNAFVNEFGVPDAEGTVVNTRTNAEGGAIVSGVNMEFNVIPSRQISLKSGFTIQKSEYETPQEFGEKKFFRTPDNYGFLTFDYTPTAQLGISTTANYTGKMLVPYFGPTIAHPEEGELRVSESFFDWGAKLRYEFELKSATLQVFGGVKNILNSYQHDFDSGADRDPGYMYGPGLPRTVYFGIKIGNFLQ